MNKNQYNYITNLTYKEIGEALSKQNTSNFIGGWIHGRIKGREIQISCMTTYRNSWTPIFYGTLEDSPDGRMITGSFRTHPFVDFFMIAFRGFLGFAFVIALSTLFVQPSDEREIMPIIVMLGMLLFSFGLEKFGKFLGKMEIPTILKFIEKELQGKAL
jgi:hypothetical protein